MWLYTTGARSSGDDPRAARFGHLTLRYRRRRGLLKFVKREQDVEDLAVGHSKAAERRPLLVSERGYTRGEGR